MTEYCENEAFETYCEDMVEKQKIVHSNRNNRPHRRTPYMTRKEIEAMHGEVKIHNLNKPMSWKEFKAMPDDLKIQYIQVLRERFGVSDVKISYMFGMSDKTISKIVNDLGIGNGKIGRRKGAEFDETGWNDFVNSGKASLEVIEEPEPVTAEPSPTQFDLIPKRLLAKRGTVEFEGAIDEVCRAMEELVGCGNYRFVIRFDSIHEERSDCYAE